MARKHAYRNDQINAGTQVDLAGQTVDYAHGGELRLGANAGFLNDASGHQSYNADGTKTSQPAQDELISSYIACEICGLIVTDKRQLTTIKNRRRCKDCCRDVV